MRILTKILMLAIISYHDDSDGDKDDCEDNVVDNTVVNGLNEMTLLILRKNIAKLPRHYIIFSILGVF